MKIKLTLLVSLLLITSSRLIGGESIKTCKVNRNAPPVGEYAWPSDAEVKVYFFRNMFTPMQREALLNAMGLWNQLARRTGSGIRLIYAGEANSAAVCDNCLLVVRQDIRKYANYFAYFQPLRRNSDGLIVSAWIVFDHATTDPQALQVFMTHELGHGMGLGNCPRCKQNDSIMISFPRILRVDRLIEPSACDLEVVSRVYQTQRHRVLATAAVLQDGRD